MYNDDEDELQPLDYTKLRYALYVRKSTDDESKQLRSLEDQIAECEVLARRLGIRLVKPYLQEKKSAKLPNNRPVFTQLLKDIRHGTYDGIVAWHPDRLARNMREGGELIDMLDEKILKDLRFVTHYFTNDANGKMLLGMAFVLSKHYSDDLSQKVTHGVRRSFREGKSSGTPKYGYIRDEQGIYQPDGKNFELICEAWRMRRNAATYTEIADYLNANGYGRRIKGQGAKRKGQVLKMGWKRLSYMFSDPFYYGVLVQAKKTVDLRAVPGYNFQPAVSEADWNSIQAMTKTRRQIMAKTRQPFYPLRKLVLCSFCGHAMYVGASKGHHGKRYLYYRCHTEGCSRQPKSIRAKKIFEWLYEFLGDGLPLTQEDYERYSTRLVSMNERKRQRLAIRLHSKQGALKAVQRDINERSLAIVGYDKTSTIWKVNNDKIGQLDAQREDLEQEVKRITQDSRKLEGNVLSIEQFLNLAKLAGSKLEAAGPVAKDRICRLLFLNLVVNSETVVDFQMREPFATLIGTHKISSGGAGATKLEPFEALCDAILQHWDTSAFKDQTDFDNLFAPAYNVVYEY
jgi:site-specific DNA recombinase